MKAESLKTVSNELPFKRSDGSNPLNLSTELLFLKHKEIKELQEVFSHIPFDILALAWDAHYVENKNLYNKSIDTNTNE